MEPMMTEYLKAWPSLKADSRAVAALEYVLMAGVLALAVFAVSTILGNGIDNSFSSLAHLL
jgi:Flp pilus assembly pilin Flp